MDAFRLAAPDCTGDTADIINQCHNKHRMCGVVDGVLCAQMLSAELGVNGDFCRRYTEYGHIVCVVVHWIVQV
jgi:hypothetical protein